MKHLLLSLFLVCGNVSAAQWVLAAERGSTDFYIDALSVEASGKYRRAWIMADLPEPRKVIAMPNGYYLSTRQLQYFDCARETSAVTHASFYSGHMGRGKVVEEYTADLASASFSRHLPDTLKKRILEAVCSVAL